MSRCPSCDSWLPTTDDCCRRCGLVIPTAPVVEDAIPEAEAVRPRRRLGKLRRDEPEEVFGDLFRSWGVIAGGIVYVPSVVLLAWYAFMNLQQVRGPGIVYLVFGGAFLPAGAAYMLVDGVQATYNWWTDPREGPDRPLINLLAGPIRLAVIGLCPLGGAGLCPLVAPQSLEWALLIGALVGMVPGLLAALVLTLIVKAM